ncbi:MAG: cytidine deaminase [Myxococcaceae bacterium]
MRKARARAGAASKKAVPWSELFAAAGAARLKAYAPYSEFAVGAAVLCDDGTIIAGCNVENASYGLAVCAERSAIARMVLEGKRRLRAVAIVVDTPRPTPPCGMCRQVMREFGGEEVPVRCRNLRGKEDRRTLGELLPYAFTRAFL